MLSGQTKRITPWFSTSLGQSLLREEQSHCARLIPSRYYPSCLQVGLTQANFLAKMETHRRFVVDTEPGFPPYPPSCGDQQETHSDAWPHKVVAVGSALPFAEKTHDLIVMPHTLDFCPNPHDVLRQVSQILTPEGCVVIIGFNMLSFYGLVRLVGRYFDAIPWNGQYYRVGRVQDWLSLLGFDLVGAGMIAYQPPLQKEQWRAKLSFLDQVGNRWWPGLGGIYLIVGRKKEMAITASPAKVQRWRQLLPGMAQPVTQRAAKATLEVVVDNSSHSVSR